MATKASSSVVSITVGTKGKQRDVRLCPVAKGLRAAGFTHIYVDESTLSFSKGQKYYKLRAPSKVRKFIARFDALAAKKSLSKGLTFLVNLDKALAA